eukprot:gene31908-41399_t
MEFTEFELNGFEFAEDFGLDGLESVSDLTDFGLNGLESVSDLTDFGLDGLAKSDRDELKSVQTFRPKSVKSETDSSPCSDQSLQRTQIQVCLTKQQGSHYQPILRALRMDIKNPTEFIKGVNSRDSAVGQISLVAPFWLDP